MAAVQSKRIKSVNLWGTQRLTLADEALVVEERTPVTGAWQPARRIYYDDIQAVYTYEAADWAYLATAILYGFLGGLALVVVGTTASVSAATWALGLGLLALFIAALAGYRIFLALRPWVRVEAVTGSYVF